MNLCWTPPPQKKPQLKYLSGAPGKITFYNCDTCRLVGKLAWSFNKNSGGGGVTVRFNLELRSIGAK